MVALFNCKDVKSYDNCDAGKVGFVVELNNGDPITIQSEDTSVLFVCTTHS